MSLQSQIKAADGHPQKGIRVLSNSFKSIHKDKELLNKLGQYIYPAPESPVPSPEPVPGPTPVVDPIQRKFEAMEREIRLLNLRVSEQGVEVRRLTAKQEHLDHACAEHQAELEELRNKQFNLEYLITENKEIPDNSIYSTVFYRDFFQISRPGRLIETVSKYINKIPYNRLFLRWYWLFNRDYRENFKPDRLIEQDTYFK